MRNCKMLWFLLVMVSFLAACTAGAPGDPLVVTKPAPAEPQQSTSTTIPMTTPAIGELPTVTPVPVNGQGTVVAPQAATAGIKMLSDRLNIAPADIQVVRVEETQWPDGCLGAGKPDEMCTQAIVDGYRIVLQVNGQNYEFHTDLTGKQVREVQIPGPKGGNIITGSAVTRARQFLAQELGLAINEIKLQSAKPVDWPDSCLGVVKAGQVCSQVITPGYQFTFLAGEKQYEIHSDNEGGVFVLAQNTRSVISGTVVTFEKNEKGTCSHLEAGKVIKYGPCAGPFEEAQLSAVRADELSELFSSFAPFSADTKAGKIVFQGSGSKVATSSEQRSMAEWAWLVFQEAQSGRSGAALGLVMSWHRQGGIAGFCDDLAIYSSGWAYATSCRTNSQGERYYRLSSQELDQLFAWADQYANSEMKQEDAPGAADSMAITILLSGSGTAKVPAAPQQDMLDFAQRIFNAAK